MWHPRPMIHEEQTNMMAPGPCDSFNEAFSENLEFVLDMLDCMRSESELVGRQEEADFLGGIRKALSILERRQRTGVRGQGGSAVGVQADSTGPHDAQRSCTLRETFDSASTHGAA